MPFPVKQSCLTTKRPLGYPKKIPFWNHDDEAEDNLNLKIKLHLGFKCFNDINISSHIYTLVYSTNPRSSEYNLIFQNCSRALQIAKKTA